MHWSHALLIGLAVALMALGCARPVYVCAPIQGTSLFGCADRRDMQKYFSAPEHVIPGPLEAPKSTL